MQAKINANVARAICTCTLGTFPLNYCNDPLAMPETIKH